MWSKLRYNLLSLICSKANWTQECFTTQLHSQYILFVIFTQGLDRLPRLASNFPSSHLSFLSYWDYRSAPWHPAMQCINIKYWDKILTLISINYMFILNSGVILNTEVKSSGASKYILCISLVLFHQCNLEHREQGTVQCIFIFFHFECLKEQSS